jgi:hypothetical protein
MGEDRKRAQEMATQDLKNLVRQVVTDPGQIIAYDNEADWPDDDGAGAFIPFTMGLRGELTKQAARKSADVWRKVTWRYPKAGFCIQLAGYDQDPRAVWEFPEAARYVRWWARFAGMDDIEIANNLVGDGNPMLHAAGPPANGGLGFLAACGVFGDELKKQSLAGLVPTVKQ